MQAIAKYHPLEFKQASGTSRGVLRHKDSWFIQLTNDQGLSGIGECSTIPKLSPDIDNNITEGIEELCNAINNKEIVTLTNPVFQGRPALKFAYEMAALDLKTGGEKLLYPSAFIHGEGIPINGLVWMGEKSFMFDQIKALLDKGYNCIKIKIAAIDFEDELNLLKYIRSQFSPDVVEIRVDANGGFSPDTALEKLKQLSKYNLHSIEQPIKPKQFDNMAHLCSVSPIAIALDEELIGVDNHNQKAQILTTIKPQYIILKPSLVGGFAASQEWIDLADGMGIAWWVTSALEANIGLNALAQWTATLDNEMHQGLGTGQLYVNNIASPLDIESGKLYHRDTAWANIEF